VRGKHLASLPQQTPAYDDGVNTQPNEVRNSFQSYVRAFCGLPSGFCYSLVHGRRHAYATTDRH
jgi:hypothetical protein